MLSIKTLRPLRWICCNRFLNSHPISYLSQANMFNNIHLNMGNDEVMMEQVKKNSKKGEDLVDFLKKEIALIKKAATDKSDKEMAARLEEENARLKEEIALWKSKVIQLEVLNGIKQYPLPSDVVNSTDVQLGTPPIEKTSVADKISESATEVPKASPKPKGGAKKEKSPKTQNESKDENREVDVSRLDLRVGRILSAKKHPDAESLYVEEIDVGEEKPRTVVSGLVKFVPIEEMQNHLVVVLCNLKPAKMRGVTSEAMVMCASTPDKVEILCPPENSVPGDKVVCDDYPGVADALLPPKKKIFEQVAPDLKTNDDCIATYKLSQLKVSDKGVVKSNTLAGAPVK